MSKELGLESRALCCVMILASHYHNLEKDRSQLCLSGRTATISAAAHQSRETEEQMVLDEKHRVFSACQVIQEMLCL